MAVCLDCKADYLSGITVCPACHKPLEGDPPGDGPTGEFVPLMMGWGAEVMSAQATLEAAGIPARVFDENAAIFVPTIRMTLSVPASDLEAAREVLRRKPE